jgi:hypothetical protein
MMLEFIKIKAVCHSYYSMLSFHREPLHYKQEDQNQLHVRKVTIGFQHFILYKAIFHLNLNFNGLWFYILKIYL